MKHEKSLFFCAIGGSGMLPLAMIMKARGYEVAGSDRSHDQKRLPERFAFIEKQGLHLFPQNGSGLSASIDAMIVSTAVEKTVPDYVAALEHKIPVVHRATLLAQIVNEAKTSLAVAGTSGKSTTTGMLGWLLYNAKANPTIINGAVMKNFISADIPFASSTVGDPDLVVAEVDESDGSIAHFSPTIAVLNNIAVDHKSMEELRALFAAFVGKAEQVVLNLDNDEAARLALPDKTITYSLANPAATLLASAMVFAHNEVTFQVTHTPSGETAMVTLRVPGHHNISNALAALGGAMAYGLSLTDAAQALHGFNGIARRMDIIGTTKSGITIIDDFAHNPDKIAASLRTLHQTEGRLLILFQPHGYGPLKSMRAAFATGFAKGLAGDDILYLPDPLYLGGTTERDVTSADLVNDITDLGAKAVYLSKREDCAAAIIRQARPADRIIIMGARDDTLPALAKEMLFHLGS